MAEMIIGLSQSNTQMKTTLRYLDQIQRSTDRLNRVRYQGLIKVNNELRTTGRRLENIYSTAVRLSRLRITPRIGLDDQLSPALDRALTKLNSFRNQLVKASGTVSVEVKQKVEVAMGKITPASASSMSVVIGSHNTNTTINNVAKEEDKALWEKALEWTSTILDIGNNASDIWEKQKKWRADRKAKKNKAANPSASTEVAEGKQGKNQTQTTSDVDTETKRNKPFRRGMGGRSGRGRGKSTFRTSRASNPVTAPAPKASELITDFSHAEDKRLRMEFEQKMNRNKLGFASASPMGMSNLFSGDGMMGKIGGGFAKGAKRLLGPISMLADVANIASAPPEERGRAVGSMIGGTAGTAIGSALGTLISPVIGTYVGGAVGGWLGSEAGGWIGSKSEAIGNFFSQASEGASKVFTGAVDFVSEKTKSLTEGISNFFGFGSKNEEQTTPAATVASSPSVPAAPQMPPSYRPAALSITGPEAYMNNRFGSSTSAGLTGTSMMQSQAMALNNNAQSNGKASPMTVHISEEQMSSLSGYLKDFKTETTNQIAVNIAPGTVQVTVRENAIDYDAVSHQVGQRISNEFRKAMQNRKTIMA
ncbi:hypothetical protein GCM10008014_27480 [Paenibacillus silvae]|uniref:MFS transporter n=1 Tax=Paenibacillus silvae TaxID=1325358 RepID=A0ABQ1ZEF1_9BACL|nr:hypothetical protein [Paenibacillus silvae]GGH56628.1 hypothetical protein GCM10008014_27480 [Paenibacillus silvae]